ncbi:MAG: aldehyde dehydrogenase family protein, partial [Actinobacteria bacterium]|nr:aldehyde dehydrogenase family protein [Actinomycetota bacterium]
MKRYDKLFIGGEWVAPKRAGIIEVFSPATEQLVGVVPEATEADVDAAVAAARSAFDQGPWPKMSIDERAAVLRKVAVSLQNELESMATIITEEMGALFIFSQLGQVMAPSMVFSYYADLASSYSFEEVRTGVLSPEVLVRKEPLGVVGAIIPWNVPLFLASAKLAPALLAGCTVVLKTAPETPMDAFRLAEIFEEAGLPRGVLSVLP